MIALQLLVVFEPSQTWGLPGAPRQDAGYFFAFTVPLGYSLAVEGPLILVLFYNFAQPFVYMRRLCFFSHTYNVVCVALVAFMAIDWLTAVGFAAAGETSPRLNRMFRGVFILEMNRSVQHCMTSAFRSVPAIRDLLFLLLIFILVFALLGLAMFKTARVGSAHKGAFELNATITWTGSEQYENIFSGFVNFFVLWSTDNYPTIMQSPMTGFSAGEEGGRSSYHTECAPPCCRTARSAHLGVSVGVCVWVWVSMEGISPDHMQAQLLRGDEGGRVAATPSLSQTQLPIHSSETPIHSSEAPVHTSRRPFTAQDAHSHLRRRVARHPEADAHLPLLLHLRLLRRAYPEVGDRRCGLRDLPPPPRGGSAP